MLLAEGWVQISGISIPEEGDVVLTIPNMVQMKQSKLLRWVALKNGDGGKNIPVKRNSINKVREVGICTIFIGSNISLKSRSQTAFRQVPIQCLP